MPRRGRGVLAGYPHHIIQRGPNKGAVFVHDEDCRFYLENIKEWKEKLGCKIYASCLMTNHVHLVLDPGENSESLSLLMKRRAGRKTRYINRLEKSRGTSWEGRYKSSPIQDDKYLHACCRSVELNPVRAFITDRPEGYRWSSYRYKTGFAGCDRLDQDPLYRSMGSSENDRQAKYKAWMRETIPEGEWKRIREAVQRGQLTGSRKFVDEVERRMKLRVEFRGPGRLRNKNKSVPLL
jgi:putative transposase